MLTGDIELRDGQTGFAGVSGTVWNIDRQGKVQVARFLNEKTDAPDQRGQLSAQDAAELACVFREQRFTDLPETLGERAEVNPRILTLRYGPKTVTLFLPAGDPVDPDAMPATGEEQARFVTLARLTRRLAAQSSR